jgi:UDP-N-acetylglucosamine 2-epimerase (non-hydrolysing)
MKTVLTIIENIHDSIRMSSIFKKLDIHFNHIIVYTEPLSRIISDELKIRQPDYTLTTDKVSNKQYQFGNLSASIIDLIKEYALLPDIILFFGDSDATCLSLPLKKEGYLIGHIEAGGRSGNKNSKEINQIVCDHCSDILFVNGDDYRDNLVRENIKNNIYVVGNTIVEVCTPLLPIGDSLNILILVDIRHPDNFKSHDKMENILFYANKCAKTYGLPVKMLNYSDTTKYLEKFQLDLGLIEIIDSSSYKTNLLMIHHCKFMIADSEIEEPFLMKTPVIVPRNYTEIPKYINEFILDVNYLSNEKESILWLEEIFCGKKEIDISCLGDYNTSDEIVQILNNHL